MSRPTTHTATGLKIEAYRCTWDRGGESAVWVQYHGDDDPMPEAWDDEPDEVLALVAAVDAGAKIQALAEECQQLRRWKSTNAPRLEALEGLLATAQREAAAGAEAIASLQSERAANAILTDECEWLRAALQEADTIMGHDDAPTEWRDKWAGLWGYK